MPHNANPNLPTRPHDPSGFLLYQTEDGHTRLEVRTARETVWLSINQMADLFQRDKSSISKHIRNIFAEGELPREATAAKFAAVQLEGERQVTRDVEHFNLDVIISVGYRVKSHRGTQFRICRIGVTESGSHRIGVRSTLFTFGLTAYGLRRRRGRSA